MSMFSIDYGPEYHKIHSAFKRDTSTKRNVVIPFNWSKPEFEYLARNPWHWTEKIDGTQTRLHYNGLNVTLGGRTNNAQMRTDLSEAIRGMGLLETITWQNMWPWAEDGSPPNVTLYGEGYGPRIQKGGGLYRDDVSFILYDVKIGNVWLRRESVEEIGKGFGLDIVPFVGECSPLVMWSLLQNGEIKSQWADRGVLAEGVVGIPEVPLTDRMGSRVVMKMKYKDVHDLIAERGSSE